MRSELAESFRGKEIEVKVRRKRKRSSDRQRRYYFAVIVESFYLAFYDWAPDVGWTRTAVHDELKKRFLPLVKEWAVTIVPSTGEVIQERMSTQKLNIAQRELYHEHCRKWGAEMDILIPLPNEQAEINFSI
jgi:hypothetical protein